MKRGARVSFSWDEGRQRGTGTVIMDEVNGTVLVSCDPTPPEARHFVILCTVTWLTVIG